MRERLSTFFGSDRMSDIKEGGNNDTFPKCRVVIFAKFSKWMLCISALL